MKYDLLTATQREDNKLDVLINTQDAKSLWDYLKSHGITVTPLSDAIFKVRGYSRDRDGRLVADAISGVQECQISVSISRLDDLVAAWITSLK